MNKGGNAVIRPLHESAEGFSYMSKQGDSPDYECWQQLRERPGGAQQQPFERSTFSAPSERTDHRLEVGPEMQKWKVASEPEW